MGQAVVIDGLSVLFREFHALVDLKNKSGYGTGMAYGTVKQFLYLFTKYRWHSSGVILAWDRKPKHKYEAFPAYKAKRKHLDLSEAMSVPTQIKITQRCLKYMGINQAYHDDMESDDVCASLCRLLSKKGKEVLLVSRDHDMYQCLDDNVSLLIHEQEGTHVYTKNDFINQFGIYPEDYWKVQTLGGCTTDKVPGMKGISEKTAFEIVKSNSWDKITTNHMDLVCPNTRTDNAFEKGFKTWDQNVMETLVRLRTDLKPVLEFNKFDAERLKRLFLFLEFKQYLQQDNFDRIEEIFSGKV